jgi:pyruvate/2-oxoglutarate/acetoin dehydrogenase E1 component
MMRERKFSEAVLEATDQCMAADPRVYVMGLGVTDPKGIFGTTLGLEAKYGGGRVMDMPTSENAMTGVAIGSALVGQRPILTHQRVDFALLSFDQLFNNAAKWHYMFGGRMRVPLVIRLVIGRGWGQGPQHSQSLLSVFAHFPGLKVVAPATPHDAKGLLIAAVEDDNPVVYLEHRWLHGTFGPVPAAPYRVPIGPVAVARPGTDVTIVATSYMTIEALRAAARLAEDGIEAEVLDVRTLRPLDHATIRRSVEKTGHLVLADIGWTTGGFTAEVLARLVEDALPALRRPPRRIGSPDCPAPTSPALARHYYPEAADIVAAVAEMLGRPLAPVSRATTVPADVPDARFAGPF